MFPQFPKGFWGDEPEKKAASIFNPKPKAQSSKSAEEIQAQVEAEEAEIVRAVDELISHTTLIGPKAGAALAKWPTTDGGTLGATKAQIEHAKMVRTASRYMRAYRTGHLE